MERALETMSANPRQAKAYALRFISGKYQGGEFPLPDNGEIVIGRSSELDMVLVEDMVSRRHAKISCVKAVISIRDLGSTNGTFVNGEKIKEATLKEGDRILVGTSIIKVVIAEVSASAEAALEAKAKMQDVSVQKRTSHVRTMTGNIAEIPLPDLLQLFGASKKSGVLVIRTERHVGKIHLDTGIVQFTAIDDNYTADPAKSFVRIMTWTEGTFDMEAPEERVFEKPMGMSTEGLLMDAMRQIDEFQRLGEGFPDLSAEIVLASPMDKPLKDLSPEDLDMLQLMHNQGSVQALLKGGEAKGADRLKKLIADGYLVVKD
jgi:pSer/pThr/pTyr-binding forkhead associated (FHA) protein